jgi:DNA polymerase I-like protein with 3'-5' exonuclease and polymerase domains
VPLVVVFVGKAFEASEDDAQKLIDGWMQGYEKAGQWLNQQKGLVYKSIRKYQWKDGQQGRVYIRGFDGRLLMPTFIVGDKESEGGAKRDCKNFPIQSANAVSIKRCLPALDADLSRLYPTAMIVNCIHDEIVVECDDDENAQDICNLVQKHMEDAATFYIKNVNIKADAKVCNDWSEK